LRSASSKVVLGSSSAKRSSEFIVSRSAIFGADTGAVVVAAGVDAAAAGNPAAISKPVAALPSNTVRRVSSAQALNFLMEYLRFHLRGIRVRRPSCQRAHRICHPVLEVVMWRSVFFPKTGAFVRIRE
jgi:hypothetical protein